MLVALPVALLFPGASSLVFAAGLVGGVVPDLDMYSGHRKTLHYPVYYALLAGSSAVGALLVPLPVTLGLTVFFAAAAVHSISDIFGGGLELHPWEKTSERAVYNHHQREWVRPRHWIKYDGSPGDLLLSAGVVVPLWLVVDSHFRWILLAALTVGAVYTAVRRVLPTIAISVAQLLPERVAGYLPRRYRVETGHHSRSQSRRTQES